MSKYPGLLPVAIAAITGAALAGTALHRQDDAPSPEELIAQAQPGPEHERLTELAGEWEVILRPAASGAEETLGEGFASTILDGRYLVLDFSLGSEQAAGSYRYTLGFDRRHGEYSIVVMDTQGTYFVTARGVETSA